MGGAEGICTPDPLDANEISTVAACCQVWLSPWSQALSGAQCGLVEPDACGCWLPTWLPCISPLQCGSRFCDGTDIEVWRRSYGPAGRSRSQAPDARLRDRLSLVAVSSPTQAW